MYKKTNITIVLIILSIIILITGCTGAGSHDGTRIIGGTYNFRTLESLCNEISYNWVGIDIRYDDYVTFLDECTGIIYKTDMEMAQEIRKLVPDGHFYFGLDEKHPENHFEEAKIIPLTVTEDKDGNTVIAKSTEKLREKGLAEGNIILKINDKDVLHYLHRIMEMLPQSTIYETKEKAYRLLFSKVLSTKNTDTWDSYFELPTINEDEVKIKYKDPITGKIGEVITEFELLESFMPLDKLSVVAGSYWSLHDYYDVPEEDTCLSQNEFLTMKEIDGETWMIYHPFDFLFNFETEDKILENYQCYIDYVDKADRFVLDLRDSMGGYVVNIDTVLGLINVRKKTQLYFSKDSNITIEPSTIEGLPTVPEDIPVYIWSNSICGSACDIFLYSVKNSADEHIKIIGKPSAGRVQAVTMYNTKGFDISMPFRAIYDENLVQMEGKSIMPDYYFDVEASAYRSPDTVFESMVDFINTIEE
jgi:hypothetical protein